MANLTPDEVYSLNGMCPVAAKTKIGDRLSSIEAGLSALSQPQWDDLLVPLSATSAFGANPPRLLKLADTGETLPGYALYFSGSGSYATLPNFGNFSASYTVSFWAKSDYTGGTARTLIEKPSAFRIRLRSAALRVSIGGSAEQVVSAWVAGARNFVVVTVDVVAGVAQVYVNNNLETTFSATAAASTDIVELIASNLDCLLNEVRFYQAVLSESQIDELWADGIGTTDEPVGVPALMAGYHCNAGSGTNLYNYQGNATYDGTLYGVEWVDGLIDVAATPGVIGFAFPGGENCGLQFVAQMPHGWKVGSDYNIHVHWHAPAASVVEGNVRLGVEIRRASIGEVWPENTSKYHQIVRPADYAAREHRATGIVTLAGIGYDISHVIQGRVFREGADPSDTFPNSVIIDYVDLHYQKDALGSRQEWVK